MDAIGFIISRHFIVFAITSTYIHRINDGPQIVVMNAKKAHKIAPNLLLSIIGNPYKATHLKKYILKIAELGDTKTFDSVIADLLDVFNTADLQLSEMVKRIGTLLLKYKRDDGYVDTRLVEQELTTDEEITLLRDMASSEINSHTPFSIITLMGYEKDKGVEMANLISIGSQIHDTKHDNLPENQFFFQVANTTTDTNEELKQELVSKFSPYLIDGWYKDEETIAKILDLARTTLTEGIHRITPGDAPNVVFYELSFRTGYEFKEPDIPLGNVDFNYNSSNTGNGLTPL